MAHREPPIYRPANHPPGSASYEEERREVLESVFEALCRQGLDADETAACGYLIQHLTGAAFNPPVQRTRSS
jgi:hypothetical protein